MAHELAEHSGLFRRADDTVEAEHLRLLCARLNQIGHVEPITRGVKIAVVVRRQHGDCQQFEIRPRAPLDGCFQRLRIGVHGQERRTQFGHALHATRDRVTDVVQLEIEEDLLAGFDKLGDHRQSTGITELIAYLVKGHAVAEPGDHGFRGSDTRKIERHDQAIARGDSCRLHGHLTSSVVKLRSIAAPGLSTHRYRPDFSICPYRHKPRPQMTARSGWE